MSIARIRGKQRFEREGLILPDGYSAEEFADHYGIKGYAELLLTTEDGDQKLRRIVKNLITQVGDQFYLERALAIGTEGTTRPPQVTGMKLGINSTGPTKTGAAAALGSYLAGSQRAIDSGFPTSSLTADATPKRRGQFKSSWAAAVATHPNITEAVLVNDALADATSAAASTIARILTNPGAPATGIAKGANDTLEVVWNHELLGA
ncbi:hypothetical protein [uncultured Arthrobacter sp.]|uniref:hypothetical protein n=1 Tax=uncultured Arthrobacter sp. TaxID=114050 RepID=UPI0025EF2426|nr:hypothetical protein [uncultured Arthrobacter sp.]